MNVNEIETNQLKLSYKEISPCSESAATNWKTILEKGDVPVDKRVLLDAVKAGERVLTEANCGECSQG